MTGNRALNAASKAKKDEFYTCLENIEEELAHYREHFRDKIILCNCDDPYESNFFKYFALNFNRLGLKKLITTCYVGSPVSHTVMCLDDWLNGKPNVGTSDSEIDKKTGRKKIPYKIEITEVEDFNKDGAVDLCDVEYLLKNDANTSTILEGRGDFRSDECIQVLKEADIVVTNPPFSLFREYVAMLMKYDKKFLIIGNQNALTYKEFFPLIRENKVWLGYNSGDMSFMVPDDYEERETRFWIDENGQKWRSLGTITWYTNLDHKKRHEPIRLYAKYDPEKYPKYDNYDAIEVSKVSDIPEDYMESMGVPITFMDKFCPEQFEIVGFRKGADGQDLVYTRERESLSVSENPDKKEAMTMICKDLGIPEEDLHWCNGAMGVPITFLDKYSPEQFQIIGATESEGKGFSEGLWNPKSKVAQPLLSGIRAYKRIFIKQI